MGVQVAGTWSASTTPSQAAVFAAVVSTVGAGKRKGVVGCTFLGAGESARLLRTRSMEVGGGRGRQPLGHGFLRRRAFGARTECFPSGGADDGRAEEDNVEEFVQRLEESILELQQQQGNGGDASLFSASFCLNTSSPPSLSKQEPSTEPPWVPVRPEPPDWPGQIVPACVEKNANSVELPLSLRIIKRKKRWEDGGWLREAGESAYCSVKRAFSSMVFIIRELQSYTLQMREELFCEDFQGIVARVHQEMNSSFVWLFQQIFSCTPTLMVSVMLLLANFTVYSMGHLDAPAMAAPNPLTQLEKVVMEHRRHIHRDQSSIKTTSIGRTASVGGNGGGGGRKAGPVAGATGDGRSDEGSVAYGSVFLDGISTAPGTVTTEEGAMAVEHEEARVWKGMLEEVSKMQGSTRDDALMDEETLRRLVSPVAVDLEADDYADYLRTELTYQNALSQDPENALLLANFAQFLYLVLRDHNRAEYYFKKAVGTKPDDAEALSRYASFLWVARKDLAAAEERFLEAVAADPGNPAYAAAYAHFLWNTGGDDTCYPLEAGEAAA
ncbi:uncharacterized protein LOC122036194 [Zingiber officinale]|uniref:Tetratricopeptide repeat (TPR)-like superfamily protein n=1 Tax=Zingiber officinale TaxID=94328 RepID=A0A8J5EKM2_ZINOF|nr:uncharacterized protein LOC122036194 [Zingiber officinale]KAG6466380.1 hypothetical protein ZIOFF_075873 [Zingiber officinale]